MVMLNKKRANKEKVRNMENKLGAQERSEETFLAHCQSRFQGCSMPRKVLFSGLEKC